jgi:hypothetical protein
MTGWRPISEFPKGLTNVPVLLYAKEWVSEYEPDGIVQGFIDSDGNFLGGFWNNYQDTWDCENCKPTHFMLLHPPEGEY